MSCATENKKRILNVKNQGHMLLNARLPINYQATFKNNFIIATFQFEDLLACIEQLEQESSRALLGELKNDDDHNQQRQEKQKDDKGSCFCICHKLLEFSETSIQKTSTSTSTLKKYYSTCFTPAFNDCITCYTHHRKFVDSNFMEKFINQTNLSAKNLSENGLKNYNKLVFYILDQRNQLCYFSNFFGNSTLIADKAAAQLAIKPAYESLKNLRTELKLLKSFPRSDFNNNDDTCNISFKKLGIDDAGKETCARLRIFNGERYQKNKQRNFKRKSESLSQRALYYNNFKTSLLKSSMNTTTCSVSTTNNNNDYFSKIYEKKLVKFTKKVKISQKCNRKNYFLSSSKIHGRGLFALKDFKKDEKIIEYIGEVIRGSVSDRRQLKYRNSGQGNYLFKLDDEGRFIIDATKFASMARFVNHSCQPNCHVTNFDDVSLVLTARRAIKAGSEFTYDYGYMDEVDCNCASVNCKGIGKQVVLKNI